MAILTEEENEKLNDAGLFYNISGINYDFNVENRPVNPDKSRAQPSIVTVSTSYEPVFDFLKDIYICSHTSRKSSTLLFKAGKRKSENCLILVHGFKSKNKQIYLQLGKRFAANGIDGAVYTLPYHFERKYLEKAGNDVLDLEDFRATLEFFRQTVIELRFLIRVLKKLGYRSVGVLGFSFGGYCCSLLACFDDMVDFIIPMASMGDFGNLLILKRGKNNLDLDEEGDKLNDFFISKYLDLICPINYSPLINADRMLFIQGLFDIRAPYRSVMRLKEKWGDPKIAWLPCDHSTFFLFNHINLMIAARFIKNL